MTKPETERERLLNRLFPPGEPEKHIQNIDFFRGTHPGAIDPEVFCAEVNKALDAVERGDGEVFDHFPDAASPPAPSVPDDLTADLMRFYDVKTVPELIAAQYRHIQRLQEKLPKPRDDFPVSPRHG